MKSEEMKVKCEHCNFLADNRSIQMLHELSHQISLVDIMKNLPPSIKEASFKTEDEFETDLKIFLDNSSVSSSEYKSMISDHKDLTVECKECGKRFTRNSSMKRHTKTAHKPENPEESRIDCKNCGMNFSVESLARHMQNVHNETKTSQEVMVECKKCGKRFSSSESMKRHRKRAHEQESRIECKTCGTNLYRDSLARHMRTIHNEKSTRLQGV